MTKNAQPATGSQLRRLTVTQLALLLGVHRDTARAHLQAAGLTPCGTDQRGNPVYLSSRAVREIVRRTK